MQYNFPDHRSGDTWKGIYSLSILECNSAVNLTDCDVFIQFRSKTDIASPVFLELNTYNNDIKILSEENGTISIPAKIISLPVGEYSYDLQINFPTGRSKTFLNGDFKILPQITKTATDPRSIYAPKNDQRLILAADDDRILTSDGERLNYI
jgi:hypothetical protein